MLRYWACRIPGLGSRECHVGEEAGGVHSLKVGVFQNYLFLHKHLNSRINRVHGFAEQQTMSSRRAQEPTAWVGRASVHHPDVLSYFSTLILGVGSSLYPPSSIPKQKLMTHFVLCRISPSRARVTLFHHNIILVGNSNECDLFSIHGYYTLQPGLF